MTSKERESARQRLTRIVQEQKATFGYRRSDAVEEAARQFETSEDRFEALLISAERLYGETERLNRTDGLRAGYKIERNGQVCSLALLDQTFREARKSVRREILHARGALERGEWDRYLLGICEQRARERGIDPDVTELYLCQFVDTDEAQQLYRDWQRERDAV